MPRELFDEDSNAIEVPTVEEIAEMKAGAEKLAELQVENEKYKTDLEEASGKDEKKKYNFDNLRRTLNEKDDIIKKMETEKEMTETDKKLLLEKVAEKDEVIGKYTEMEQDYVTKEKVREDRLSAEESAVVAEEIKRLGNGDVELEKKIQFEFDRGGDFPTPDKLQRAFTLATAKLPSTFKGMGSASGAVDTGGKKGHDKALYAKMFPNAPSVKKDAAKDEK